jgi:hypothetical protein
MRYQVRVAGKIFQGNDVQSLLKRAVEARRKYSFLDAKMSGLRHHIAHQDTSNNFQVMTAK